MKTLLALGLAGLFLASAAPVRAQTNAQGVQVAVDGIFSFTGPPGWTLQDNPGQAYKKLTAPATGAQAGTLAIVTDNDTTTPLGEGVLTAVAGMNAPGQNITNALVMSSQPLATAAGPTGLRVVINATAASNNTSLVEVFYLFRYSKGTVMFIAGFLPGVQSQYTPLLDSAMNSIKLQ